MSKLEPLAGERQNNESSRAVQAKNDWLRLGGTLVDLHRQYTETCQNMPPTKSLATLKDWSIKFHWAECRQLYIAEQERIKNKRAAEIMSTGLALAHERAAKLKELADFLERQLYEKGKEGQYHNVWVPDVKQIGAGEFAERIDIERYNSAIIGDYRAVLDDLAKETGGRAQKQEHSGSVELTHVKVYIPDNGRSTNGE